MTMHSLVRSLLTVLCVIQISDYFVTRCFVNTLRPRQDGRQFPDDIFRCIFVNDKFYILIKMSLKFVSTGPNNNIPSLFQIMAWRRSGDKPSSETVVISWLTHICVTRPHWVKTIPSITNGFLSFIIHILQHHSTDIAVIACQWSNNDGYREKSVATWLEKIHDKVWRVRIFLEKYNDLKRLYNCV